MILRRLAAAAALAAFVVVGAGCDDERRAISRDDLPAVPDAPTVEIELGDQGFSEDRIEVGTDDLVEFTVVGDAEHGVRTDDSTIDTGPLLPGESTEVVFDEPGRYELVDSEDDRHTMVVVASAPT